MNNQTTFIICIIVGIAVSVISTIICIMLQQNSKKQLLQVITASNSASRANQPRSQTTGSTGILGQSPTFHTLDDPRIIVHLMRVGPRRSTQTSCISMEHLVFHTKRRFLLTLLCRQGPSRPQILHLDNDLGLIYLGTGHAAVVALGRQVTNLHATKDIPPCVACHRNTTQRDKNLFI